jgi:hypothetical protein
MDTDAILTENKAYFKYREDLILSSTTHCIVHVFITIFEIPCLMFPEIKSINFNAREIHQIRFDSKNFILPSKHPEYIE